MQSYGVRLTSRPFQYNHSNSMDLGLSLWFLLGVVGRAFLIFFCWKPWSWGVLSSFTKEGKKEKKSCSFLEFESSFWRRLCQWTPTKLAWSKSIFHSSMVTTWGITQPSNQIWWCHVAPVTKFMALTTLSIVA